MTAKNIILAIALIAKPCFEVAAGNGVFGGDSKLNDCRYGNHRHPKSPRKHLIRQNKTAAKWEDFAAGKFLRLETYGLAQCNRLRSNMADFATCNTDICQISVIHRRQFAEGLAFGALISAVGAECVQRHAQLGHQTRNGRGGICGCIAHFLLFLSRLCGGLSTAFGLVCSVSKALAV